MVGVDVFVAEQVQRNKGIGMQEGRYLSLVRSLGRRERATHPTNLLSTTQFPKEMGSKPKNEKQT